MSFSRCFVERPIPRTNTRNGIGWHEEGATVFSGTRSGGKCSIRDLRRGTIFSCSSAVQMSYPRNRKKSQQARERSDSQGFYCIDKMCCILSYRLVWVSCLYNFPMQFHDCTGTRKRRYRASIAVGVGWTHVGVAVCYSLAFVVLSCCRV